jgi:hypothetical protein
VVGCDICGSVKSHLTTTNNVTTCCDCIPDKSRCTGCHEIFSPGDKRYTTKYSFPWDGSRWSNPINYWHVKCWDYCGFPARGMYTFVIHEEIVDTSKIDNDWQI